DPFIWRQAFGKKLFSTFGNPNFFGNFLVILTPITLALLLKKNADKPISVFIFALCTGVVSALLWRFDAWVGGLHMASWGSTGVTLLLCGYAFYAVIRFSFLGLLFFLITLNTVATESKGSWIGYTAGFVAFMMLVLFYFSQFQSEHLRRIILRSAVL